MPVATLFTGYHSLDGTYAAGYIGQVVSTAPMIPFLPQAASYIKNQYQLESPAFSSGTLPFNIKVETPQIANSISTTQDSLSSYSPYESTSNEYTTPSIPPTQNEWTDSDIPHCWIDISLFDTPETLKKYIIKIDQFYASAFPSCRHLLFFRSEKDVMYHIVEAHIEPTVKRFVCINCGTEFDESEEADQHASQNIISATASNDLLPPVFQS